MGRTSQYRARLFILGTLLATAIQVRGATLSANTECGDKKPGSSHDLNFANDVLKKLFNSEIEGRIQGTPVVFVCRDEDPLAYGYFTPSTEAPDRKAVIIVTTGMMQHVVEGTAGRLAAILGHEVGHFALPNGFEHFTAADDPAPTNVATLSKHRDLETLCDAFGMSLARRAGYSSRDGVGAFRRMHDYLASAGRTESAFERLGNDHPSLADRLARIDPEERTFWQSTSQFESGIALLHLHQYEAAASCFANVVKQYPGAWEAWTNLGYAQMFEFADHLDATALETLNIGQIVEVDFIHRIDAPPSRQHLPKVINRSEPIDALEIAVRLEPDSIVARANLGLAYLILPSRRNTDRSVALLRCSTHAASEDPKMDSNIKASILINLSVALSAGNHWKESERCLSKADALVDGISRDFDRFVYLKGAVLRNKAMLKLSNADGATSETLKETESFLGSGPTEAAWWGVLYHRYALACVAAGRWPKAADALSHTKTNNFRPVVGIHTRNGTFIFLGEPVAQFRSDLNIAEPPRGDGTAAEVYDVLRGVDVTADDDYIVAIHLTSSAAPAIELVAQYGESTMHEIQVGMSIRDLDDLIDANEGPSLRGLKEVFVRDLGVALQFESEKVTGIKILGSQSR